MLAICPVDGYIQGPEIDAPLRNLLLNPANVLAIGGDDLDFVQFEKSSEVLLFTSLVPAEQTFIDFAHRFEVRLRAKTTSSLHAVRSAIFTVDFPYNFFVARCYNISSVDSRSSVADANRHF